jgi:hypothetical protein
MEEAAKEVRVLEVARLLSIHLVVAAQQFVLIVLQMI